MAERLIIDFCFERFYGSQRYRNDSMSDVRKKLLAVIISTSYGFTSILRRSFVICAMSAWLKSQNILHSHKHCWSLPSHVSAERHLHN